MTYWHAYQSEVPDLTVSDQGDIGPALAFTVIGPSSTTPDETPSEYEGKAFGHELIYTYVTSWDHEPTEQEKEAVQPEQYRLEES